MAISKALKMFQRRFSTICSNQFRVCVVGSGPAGFYTAERILKKHEKAEVDIIDRLPTPYGLVRSGVAPDHPDTKIVMNQFSRVVQSERCSFIGNVALGSSISLSELRDIYDVVVLAYGAESDRVLGVPGEELPGIYSAREFVWWYNGHPDYSKLEPDLRSTDTAVILGQGNVALDVARILLRPTVELAETDIASQAVAALGKSCVRKVYVVGRRGPVQAACTAKELRELLGIKGLSIHINEADLVKTPADEEELKNNRIHRRIYELLSKAASSRPYPGQAQRELHFVFFRKPHRFLESDGSSSHVAGVQLEKTTVKEDTESGKRIAIGTGDFESIECGLVLKSIGYKSVPVAGLPFDHDRGAVPNIEGRVKSDISADGSQFEKGLYVCGWLKRGPTGIIGTNLYCAEKTVNSISEDIERGVLIPPSNSEQKPGRNGLLPLLESKNIRYVPFESWQKIDNEEKTRGRLKNKPREKLTTWPELLKTALEDC